MRTQVLRTVAGCFAALCNLRSILRSVLASVYQTLVTAPVLSRVDYGNATLIGIRLPCVVICNLCSTPLLDLSLISGAQTTSLIGSPAFTSCARLSAYNSSWRCWSSNRCMDWLRSIWSTTLSAYSWHAWQASAPVSADTCDFSSYFCPSRSPYCYLCHKILQQAVSCTCINLTVYIFKCYIFSPLVLI